VRLSGQASHWVGREPSPTTTQEAVQVETGFLLFPGRVLWWTLTEPFCWQEVLSNPPSMSSSLHTEHLGSWKKLPFRMAPWRHWAIAQELLHSSSGTLPSRPNRATSYSAKHNFSCHHPLGTKANPDSVILRKLFLVLSCKNFTIIFSFFTSKCLYLLM
jgi:hypothetical protein